MVTGKGKIVVIVAPSGTGKSTLIKKIKDEFLELRESVSFTTRPIRPSETNGKDYNFISKEEFELMISKNEFVEWAKVHSNYYGTSRKQVEETIGSGEHMLFDLDVQGADSFKKIYSSEAKIIFIEPPSIEELENRLRNRGTESEEVINERINNAKNEITRKNDFDYLVKNVDIERAYEDIKKIISSIVRHSDQT